MSVNSGVPPQATVKPQSQANEGAEEAERRYQAQLEDERRQWQRRLTKEQQARRSAEEQAVATRRLVEEQDRRMERFQAQLDSVTGSRGNGESSVQSTDEAWESAQSGSEMRRLARAEAREEFQRLQGSRSTERDEVADELWTLRLERMEDDLKKNYRGITEGDLRRVLNTAYDSGVGDLDYVAHKVLGPAEKYVPESEEDIDDLHDGIRERRRANVLAGRAALQSTQGQPQTVQLRRGHAGYADAEKASLEWATKGRR
jgi:hypothetical protein